MNKSKKAIFQAAIKVFSTSGYNGSTVDEIAAEANVAKGTLYYNFKSKEEIFNFTISKGLEIWEENLREIKEDSINPIEKLKKICRVQLTLLYNNKDFFKLIFSQLWGQENRQFELRLRVVRYIKGIEDILEDANLEGLINDGNVALMAHTFFGSLSSAAVYEFLNLEKVDLEDVIDSFTNICLNGIVKK
ncbi:MAG: TetR/AcrR family transcriptional regulator [Sarcina sp.]